MTSGRRPCCLLPPAAQPGSSSELVQRALDEHRRGHLRPPTYHICRDTWDGEQNGVYTIEVKAGRGRRRARRDAVGQWSAALLGLGRSTKLVTEHELALQCFESNSKFKPRPAMPFRAPSPAPGTEPGTPLLPPMCACATYLLRGGLRLEQLTLEELGRKARTTSFFPRI